MSFIKTLTKFVHKRHIFFSFAAVSLSVLIAVSCFEAGIGLLLKYPRFIFNERLRLFLGEVYDAGYRNVLIYEDTGRFDAELAYTLKPGVSRFSNTEFSNEFRVNRLGVRDDEESLHSPDIVVLGDSFAMGWGVEQDETYAQIIERKTGYKVLNAGVASYGTVKEFKLLDRIDLSNVKYLIVHYTNNDYPENKFFYREKEIPATNEKDFERLVQEYKQYKKYYFGKYTWKAIQKIDRSLKRIFSRKSSVDSDDEAIVFINAIMHAGHAKLDSVQIIVTGHLRFTEKLNNLLRAGNFPPFIKNMIVFDTGLIGNYFRPFYYPLDCHMNAVGHAALAEIFLSYIK